MSIVTPRRAHFDTTQWSVVLAAGGDRSIDARAALASLCETYWYPLYAYVRRQGRNAEDARDLTQSFFARLLERGDLLTVRRERGRFRSFLLASMKHFLINDTEHRRADKRGGGREALSIEADSAEGRYLREPADPLTPEIIFDRRWALTVLDRAFDRVRRDADARGASTEFEALKGCLTGEIPHGSYRALGERMNMSEGAVKVAAHRIRRRFQRTLRDIIADTVADEEDIDDELRFLWRAVSNR